VAAKVAAAAAAQEDHDSSSNSSSSKWESPPLEQPEVPELPRRSTLQSAARVTAKKAAQKAEEDDKTETEDHEWGVNVLDAMINKLGTRKKVEEDIIYHRRKREFAQRLANFSHANEDENPVMMTNNATRGFGASTRDANYSENVRLLVSGGRETGFCAGRKCYHPEMELLRKCAACKQFIRVLCSMAKNLGGEDDCFYCSRHCHPS
jgi:hypothetical protein